MDCPSVREGLNALAPLAFSVVVGLRALNGMDTGSTGGRQSITLAPTTSAGSWIVRTGSSPTAADITRTGRKGRCARLLDLGVAPCTASGDDADSPFVLGGVGKRARSHVM